MTTTKCSISAQRPRTARSLYKAGVLLGVFIAALSSAGGIGILVALVLLGVWLFLDVQDSIALSTAEQESSDSGATRKQHKQRPEGAQQ
jgi:hypothetical protein